jgi:putative glutathione S-transferase
MRNNSAGEFVRWASSFRHWVTPDGAPGPTGDGGFTAAPGRYLLYVSYACPWAHRTLILRELKGLQEVIPVAVVHPLMPPQSWVFGDYPGSTPEPVHGFSSLAQLYTHAQADFNGVVTVPVLYDRQRDTIVNNESSEIIRMLNSAFDRWGDGRVDLYPKQLRDEVDRINAFVYERINNGVYRAGFATTQAAYEEAVRLLFSALDELEDRLSRQPYLAGGQITEADWRLFTTLVRFDAVYHGHFKCNLRRLVDYPNLWAYTRALYQWPGIAGTVRLDHIKTHYYASHRGINPTGIVPLGPELDFNQPHDRARPQWQFPGDSLPSMQR